MIKGMQSYFRGVRAEFGKVVWPNRQQFWTSFAIVIVGVILIAVISGGFDHLLQLLLTKTILK